MVAIPVPPSLGPVAMAVGLHGLSDALTHRAMVPLYLLAVPPWPCTTTLLTVASVAHFAEDIGARRSLLLHACIVCCAAVLGVPSAVAVTLSYMSTVHVPCHLYRVVVTLLKGGGKGAAVRACVVACLCFLGGALPHLLCHAAAPPPPLSVTDPAQRVACVHIALHLVQPLSLSHRRPSSHRREGGEDARNDGRHDGDGDAVPY